MDSAAKHHFDMAMHERKSAHYSQRFGHVYAKIAWRKARQHLATCRAILNGGK